jgi:hypothetical protein
MAVTNTFGADYLGQDIGVSLDSPSSTVAPGLILHVSGECAVSLAGVAVLVVLALLVLLFVSIHCARVAYYVQHGAGASVFPLDR